jgi:Flp pilus assembly CpaF family ATPase
VFDRYYRKNTEGSEDTLEICVLRESAVLISKLESIINRLQAENERLQQKINGFEKIRRAYQRFIHENMPYIQNSLDNLLKELKGTD